jgi:hypothetical protein
MTETHHYSVIRKENDIELREYSSYLKAEVVVIESTYQKAIFKGFNILAGYNLPWLPGFLARAV